MLSQQLEYWKRQLAPFEQLNLPIDFDRQLYKPNSLASFTYKFDKHISSKLSSLAFQHGAADLFNILLTGFCLLLRGFSSQDNIMLGVSPHSGRGMSGVGALPLRIDIDANSPLSSFITTVESAVNDAAKHSEINFYTLISELELEDDVSRHPLYQVKFAHSSLDNDSEARGVIIDGVPALYDLVFLFDNSAPHQKTWTPSLKTLLPRDLLTQPIVETFYNT